jgi:hypothetical protein
MPGSSFKKTLFLLSGVVVIFCAAILILRGDYHTYFWQEDAVEFSSDIKPIINRSCIVCHGGVKQMGEFSLLFQEEAYSRNESGNFAIVPGNPDESEMLRLIRHHDPDIRMPLDADPLTEEEIGLLTRWIEQGAEWGEHWAYVKPEPADPPVVNSDWVNNDIDRFILKKLQDHRISPSEEADKITLLRRVSLDLTGLPPTLDEVRDFLNDDSPDAYEKVVDRLLASPAYGEHWTSMWMDLARYADSKGYEKDNYRNIWQYRDWLIKAFNEDKPFDEFTIEQLAGDLLPNPSHDQLIATAFHRNTMNNDEGGTDDEEFRVAAVIDRVNTTWEVWQATTMECAQCHNHTYDPIRMEDFYKSYAYFNNTADADVPSEAPNLKTFSSETDQERLDEIRQWVEQQTANRDDPGKTAKHYIDLIKLSEPKIHAHSFDDLLNGTITSTNSYLAVEHDGHARIRNVKLQDKDRMLIKYWSNRGTGHVEIRKDHPDGEIIGQFDVVRNRGEESYYGNERSSEDIFSVPIIPQQENHDLYFVYSDPGQEGYVNTVEWILFYEKLPGSGQPGYEQVTESFYHLLNTREEVIETPVMVELEGHYRRTTRIFDRGNWLVHGDVVTPGVPAAWNDLPEEAPENRLGLAQWLVSSENPLTARVTVNRLWAQLFGTGIVETISDFGSHGYDPSHPELLDWLALQFMNEHQWSIKGLLKQIVMSATYRQDSGVTPEMRQSDPDNRLLARGPRIRLSAEQIRDQALSVSGLLSNKMYGPSVMPPQPDGIWQQVYSGMTWETSEGEDKYRRALYTFWRRTNPYPSLITFDAPGRDVCVSLRIITNTPLQALVTLNDPVYVEAAQALAVRMIEADPSNVENQFNAGYRFAMFRDIDADKLEEIRSLYDTAKKHFEENDHAAGELTGYNDQHLAALTVVANAIMNLDEFLTKS